MAKRLSRGRLFDINQLGQAVTSVAGSSIEPSLGSQTKTRDGSLIVTDYQIDLGNAANPCTSSATTGTSLSAGAQVKTIGAVIGGATGSAQITQFSNTNHGYVSEVELVCVEAPTGGENDIGVWYSDTVTGSAATLNGGSATSLITNADQTIGLVGANAAIDIDLGGKYVYLASSGSTAAVYTAGKFVLRVYGYPEFNDV